MSAIDVRPSQLGEVRRIVEVIVTHTNRRPDDAEKYFVQVDVREEFPVPVTTLSPCER